MQTKQLKEWTSDFGNKYIERNLLEDWMMPLGVRGFQTMIGKLKLEKILEVGSNIGKNLCFINSIFKEDTKLYAVEPNLKAYEKLLKGAAKIEKAWNCDGFSLPLEDASMDLVFTSGVLIHIAPENLGLITDEIMRVSKRYILCNEYFSHTPEEKSYRNEEGLLFKRDFGAFYLERYPSLRVIDYGFLWQKDYKIFGNTNWWLFEKEN